MEAEFDAARLDELVRHARTLLGCAAILNALFLFSDWRFAGTPHFLAAVGARLAVVAVALAALWALRGCATVAALSRLMLGWMLATALGVAVLVTSRSDLALFVVILLPSIYYLAVPARFGAVLTGGGVCSALLLAGYGEHHQSLHTGLGMALAMLMLNIALAMILIRANRQARLAWLAIREERRTRVALAASQASLEPIIEASPGPLVVWDRATGDIVIANSSWRSMMRGTADALDLAAVRNHYCDPQEAERLIAMLDRDGRVVDEEVQIRVVDGEERTVLMRWTILELPQGRMVVSGLFDITERKRAEHMLAQIASTDPLTGLINRLAFFTLAEREAARLTEQGGSATLLMIDLDHFKAINDRHGHLAGDTALQAFATAAQRVLGPDRILARFGGEEFVAMISDVGGAQAMRLAERLRLAIAQLRLEADGVPVRISVSIGAATLGAPDWQLRDALARADAALYAAKRGGRNRVQHAPDGPRRLAS